MIMLLYYFITNGRKKMVRMKDIAEMVGVSINTVSHALRGKPDISPETAKRIKDAAAALGYRPNLHARSLVLRKSFTIGLAVTEINNPVRVEFCERLRLFAEKDGYKLLTIALRDNWQKNIENLLERNIDGLIVGTNWNKPGLQLPFSTLEECKKNQTPIVLFGKPHSDEYTDCVEIDFEESAYCLTQHLISRGYKDIASFTNENHLTRAAGYERAMRDSGLADRIRYLPLTYANMENAYQDMCGLLKSGSPLPQAIVAANDLSAFGAIRALHEYGIKIPEKCAVAGMDNTRFSNFSVPSLTSIGFDNGRCAEAVWQLMMNRLQKKTKDTQVNIKVHQKLFPREST